MQGPCPTYSVTICRHTISGVRGVESQIRSALAFGRTSLLIFKNFGGRGVGGIGASTYCAAICCRVVVAENGPLQKVGTLLDID